MVVDVVQNALDGIAIGAAYGLLALGFTLILGVMGRLNLAFGPSILVGIFAGAWLHAHASVGMLPVLLAVLAGTALASSYVERLAFAPFRADAALASIVSTFAIWMQLEEAVARLFPQRSYAFPTFGALDPVALGPFLMRAEHAIMLVVAVPLATGLGWLLRRTRFGLELRAMADSPGAARISGVNLPRIAFAAVLLAALIGGAAGFLIAATDGQVMPKLGLWAMLKGLIAMVIDGMGSLRGALIGGLVLGVVEAQAQWFLGAQGREIATYALLFLALILLPSGLAGRSAAPARLQAARRL